MKSILILSQYGEAFGLANRLADEGVQVYLYILDDKVRYAEDIHNNLKIVSSWRPYEGKVDCLLVDDGTHYRSLLTGFRARARQLLGGGDFRLEEGGSIASLYFLMAWMGKEEWIQFQREEKSYAAFLCANDLRLLEGDRGPRAAMGSTLLPLLSSSSLLSLLPSQEELREKAYIGPVHVAFSLEKNTPVLRGVFEGFEFDTIYAFLELLGGNLSSFLSSLYTESAHPTAYRLKSGEVSIAVRLSCYPYPGLGASPYAIHLIAPKEAEKHSFLRRHEHYGYLGTVTARGESLKEARRRVYRTISNLCKEEPEVQYRNDVGLDNLQALVTLMNEGEKEPVLCR